MAKIFDIQFEGTEELIRLAEEQRKLLLANCGVAVVITTLYGIARIANDCPVDTGRLRASICGDYASLAGVDLTRGKITEGKHLSTTRISLRRMEGQIGTNVEYALYVEYGHKATGPRKLTAKQLRYLFAVGVLKSVNGRVMLSNIHVRINRRAGIVGRVKGKGFFRKNIPLIQAELNRRMREAIEATSEGRLLGNLEAV